MATRSARSAITAPVLRLSRSLSLFPSVLISSISAPEEVVISVSDEKSPADVTEAQAQDDEAQQSGSDSDTDSEVDNANGGADGKPPVYEYDAHMYEGDIDKTAHFVDLGDSSTL